MRCPSGHENPPGTMACVHCGEWLEPDPPPSGPADHTGPRYITPIPPSGGTGPVPVRRRGPSATAWAAYVVLFLTSAIAAAAITVNLAPAEVAPPPTTTRPATTRAPLVETDITPKLATASTTGKSNPDGCDNSVSYDAAKLYDGDVGTAWRADGDGTGVVIDFELPTSYIVTKVGLLPGYAKRDPCSGDDRWPQLRRVKKVTWTFDDGRSINHDLRDQQSKQLISTNQTKPTRKLRLKIEATTPPGDRDLDFTPISEVYIRGATP